MGVLSLPILNNNSPDDFSELLLTVSSNKYWLEQNAASLPVVVK